MHTDVPIRNKQQLLMLFLVSILTSNSQFYFHLCNLVSLFLSILPVPVLLQILNTYQLGHYQLSSLSPHLQAFIFTALPRSFLPKPASHSVTPGVEGKTSGSFTGLLPQRVSPVPALRFSVTVVYLLVWTFMPLCTPKAQSGQPHHLALLPGVRAFAVWLPLSQVANTRPEGRIWPSTLFFSGPAPCFYPAAAPSSLPLVEKQLYLYGPKITFSPLKATARLMWPPVTISLTPLVYMKSQPIKIRVFLPKF